MKMQMKNIGYVLLTASLINFTYSFAQDGDLRHVGHADGGVLIRKGKKQYYRIVVK